MPKTIFPVLGEEELTDNCIDVKGFMLTEDWRPFSHIALILDYKGIVEQNLYKDGCRYSFIKNYLELLEDNNYVIRFIKFPKYDYYNFQKLAVSLYCSLDEIKSKGGHKYEELFDDINRVACKED